MHNYLAPSIHYVLSRFETVFDFPNRSGTYENSEKEDSPVRVPCYPFEKEEDGHNRSGHYLIRSPAGDCVRLYRILSLKWGTNATLREHVVIRFDQNAPGLFCSVQARCVDQL